MESSTFQRAGGCQRNALCMRWIARAKRLWYWGVSWAMFLQCIQSTWRGSAVRVCTVGTSILSLHPTAGVLRGGSWRRGSFLIVHMFVSVLRVRTPKISPVRMPSAKATRCRPATLPVASSVGWGYMGCGLVVTAFSVWAVEPAVVPARIAGHGVSSSLSVCCLFL